MDESKNSFVDPLENYDPQTYGNSLEKAIAEEPVSTIQHNPHASIRSDATVTEAVQKLASQHVACLLVEEDSKLVGVFTHREVLNKVALEMDQGERSVREVMTESPVCVHEDDPAAAALSVMAVSGYRHVPIVDSDTRPIGIVSPQRITSFLSKHFR